MKKGLVVFLFWLLLSCSVWAVDDDTVYGDGVSVGFGDIRNSLPHLYRNTPVIYVTTKSGTKSYSFNVEMYIDKGYLVYGDPGACVDLGYSNSFKQTPNGYFISGGTRGEYRYLGLSINGTVHTNMAFPEDTVPGEHVYRIVKYSSLPDYLKQRYGIPKEGNAYFESIRELVDRPDGPAWNFVHTYYDGRSVTVYQKFKESKLVGEGSVPSLFEYARITGWGAGGGSLVLYYQSMNDNSVYRYATFAGSINPDWEKVFHGLDCEVVAEDDVYVIGKDEDMVVVRCKVRGVFNDNYSGLSDVMKKFTYTRNDVSFYSLLFSGDYVNVHDVTYEKDRVAFSTDELHVSFRRKDLHVGFNLIELKAGARVGFDGCTFSSTASTCLVIYVEPVSTPGPSPIVTPTPTPALTPTSTPFPNVRRRW